MSESREEEPEPSALSAQGVELPMVAAQSGGRVEREAGGGQGEAPPDDLDEGSVRAWAREWAAQTPDWSDEQWRRINAGLGYRVRSGKRETRRPPDREG